MADKIVEDVENVAPANRAPVGAAIKRKDEKIERIGGGHEAVKMYFDYVKDDLRRAVLLTGCDTLKDADLNTLHKSEQP